MDKYIEGFGSVPCTLCGHGDCQCEKEHEEKKAGKKKKVRNIIIMEKRTERCIKCGAVATIDNMFPLASRKGSLCEACLMAHSSKINRRRLRNPQPYSMPASKS